MLLEKSTDTNFISTIVDQVVKEFPLKIEEYQNGKSGIVNMLMGEIKRRCHDKFDAPTVNELLMKKLTEMVNR